MTPSQEQDGSEDCSDPVAVRACAKSRHVDTQARSLDKKVMTDGGQAEMTAEDESEEGDDGESTSEAETAEAAEEEEAVEEETTEEEETAEEETTEEEATEEEAAEEETTEEEETAEDEAAEEEDEYHVEDAEDVYQDDDTSGVLHLDLDGLFLDLLGLEVNLNPVTLDVSARPGENNLLGNLLSAVTGLLDGAGGLSDAVSSLIDKPKELLSSLLEKPKALLSGLASKPKELLSRLFGLGGDESETAAEEPDAETEATDDESSSRIADAWSWLKETLLGLIPGFPLEDLVATIVSQVIEQLIEKLEPEREETRSDAQSDTASQAEA